MKHLYVVAWFAWILSALGQGQINLNNRGLALVNDSTGKPLTGTTFVAAVLYGSSEATVNKALLPSPFRASTTTYPGTWNPAAVGGPGAIATLKAYAWPGNIRELRNFCENAVVLRRGGKLSEYDLDPKFRGVAAAADFTRIVINPTSQAPTGGGASGPALVKSRGNRTQAAQLMGVSRRTLHRKIAQWPELDVTDK